MDGELTGRCICGNASYLLRVGFRFRPYACHCTDCQSRSGSAFSENMFVVRKDLSLNGNFDSGNYQQPSGAISTLWGCASCKTRIFAENATRPGFASLRCGTLDRSSEIQLAAHVWVKSKQSWIVIPEGVPAMLEQPRSQGEWMQLLGPSS